MSMKNVYSRGVSRHLGAWVAAVCMSGRKRKYLGRFDSKSDALIAVLEYRIDQSLLDAYEMARELALLRGMNEKTIEKIDCTVEEIIERLHRKSSKDRRVKARPEQH